MDRDQFFNNLFGDSNEHLDAIRAQSQLAYEDRIIRRVLRECGIKIPSMGKLVNECKAFSGQHRLCFEWFNAVYAFPGRLCGKRIPHLHELTLADVLKPAPKNRLFKAVVKNLQKQEIDTQQPFVFAFPVVRTMFCAHNLSVDSVGPRLHLSVEDAPLTIESTATLCAGIGHAWWG